MAETPGRNKSIDELTAEIARSREQVRRDLRGLQYELDFPAKFRRSFRRQTGSWMTAAGAVGVLIALAPMRKKKIYVDAKSGRKSQKKLVETGFALGLLKIAANMARPPIVEVVKHELIHFPRHSRGSRKRFAKLPLAFTLPRRCALSLAARVPHGRE